MSEDVSLTLQMADESMQKAINHNYPRSDLNRHDVFLLGV